MSIDQPGAGDPAGGVETELKLAVEDLGPIEVALLAAGARLSAPRVLERNIRYDDANHALSAAHRVLRLRQDSRARLTYKAPIDPGAPRNPDLNTRTEYEVTVDDFDTMHRILGALGYHPSWAYEKYRTTYTLHGCEIVLDELPYGHFVEIEGAPDAITAVQAALGLAGAPNIASSYSELFDRLRDALHLAVTDLTFAQFEGITLPRDWVTEVTVPQRPQPPQGKPTE